MSYLKKCYPILIKSEITRPFMEKLSDIDIQLFTKAFEEPNNNIEEE